MLNSLPRQNKGLDLVIFLINNQKSSNKIQATAILTAMVEAGFLLTLTNYDIDKGITYSRSFSFVVNAFSYRSNF